MAQRIRIHRLIIFALVGWAGTIWLVLSTSPDPEWTQALFFLALGCALFGTFSLGAYALSFAMFHSAAQRGNLAYASEQGLLLTALTLAVVFLSRAKAISAVSLLILLAAFLLWQVILLVRTVNVKA